MLIDWFTVGAQALNFLILVWLMKRFLYQPVLDAIDARERRVAAELADAAAKQDEAKHERDDFRLRNEAFDQQRAGLLDKARDEAKALRQRLLDEARAAADTLQAQRQQMLDNDARQLNQAISQRTRQEVFAIARKTLGDLADTSLEERLGNVFAQRLRALDATTRAGLAAALRSAAGPAIVRSAFDLPAPQRAAIQQALDETFPAQANLQFETAANLIGGIELAANGQKVAWSIDDYLASLEQGVHDILRSQAGRGSAPPQAIAIEPKPGPAAQ
ncbi:MAG: F0F1 ATP synthase subunit delta [Xanthomonadaceae bacterium]|nr:F0F1 ATP synthase subunit delta [Xanthomonadaceae bacterium]